MTSNEIRQTFFSFFSSKGHEIVPSAPIVVKNDPTLMFTNAGMNQFKDYFLGNRQAPYKRVADTQKCLRVSGKHNDLEEVGVDTYHHTMFEMLGNWSFGDYFKAEAIQWSWELLTNVYKIPVDKLYVSVFGGDEKEGLPQDNESAKEWEKYISKDRILRFGKKENFWEMGDTGPCGPCTEIHVDCRPDDLRKQVEGKTLVNGDDPQVIEIWNNVFIQYNRLKDGRLEPLPAKHVDTGMGLERLVRVLQNKNSNYDTDIFAGTLLAIEKLTGKKYKATDDKRDVAFRVIADHIRAIAFTIADGQLPSNTGAGYVIRRILRRAVRYYYSYLGYRQPLLYQLVNTLALQFEKIFPELHSQQDFIAKVIREEEDSFLRTLDKGLKKIDELIANASSAKMLKGNDVFELYDTFGFPVDLTRLIAAENNLQIDESGFEREMGKQKERSRAATAMDTEDWVVLTGTVPKDGGETNFVGYDSLIAETKATRYRRVKMKGGEQIQLVLDKTPFYAESGGQVGDTGTLSFEGELVKVTDTKKENDLIVHFVDKLPVNITGVISARVDEDKRKKTALHHSATHLLHAALRKVLGTHVVQKGSLVSPEHLRFDFSHFAKMSNEEIAKVEELVNEKIRENIPVATRVMPREEALALGAMALFGEKYGESVRVVAIDPTYSVELCGGTHVGSTGELGLLKIRSESAVAAGVRRVEAVTGHAAEMYINGQLESLRSVKEALKNPKDISRALETLQLENADLKKKVEKAESKHLTELKNELLSKVALINGVNFIGSVVDVSSADALKKLSFDLKGALPNYFIVLAAAVDGKSQVVILLDENLSKEKDLDAAAMIREIVAPLIGGGGGGQKTLATAGGQEVGRLGEVIGKVKATLDF